MIEGGGGYPLSRNGGRLPRPGLNEPCRAGDGRPPSFFVLADAVELLSFQRSKIQRPANSQRLGASSQLWLKKTGNADLLSKRPHFDSSGLRRYGNPEEATKKRRRRGIT